MLSNEILEKFFNYFEKMGHKKIPSSSLLAPNSSTLFTTAGMQQLNDYLSGEKDVIKDFGTRHLVSCQKCFRTNDIDEVGDERHHTFFEMLGNWSVGVDDKGSYFKEGAIELAIHFLLDELKLEKEKIWVTIFKGEQGIPRDEESYNLWQKFGIPKERIRECSLKDNFWGPVYQTGPCGPCSEIYYDRGEKYGCKSPNCGPNCPNCNRYLEIWNLVFMEYNKKEDGSFEKLSQTNVDTGIGFERLVSVVQEKETAYETEIFYPLIKDIENNCSLKYESNKKEFRIIADHLRAIVFLVSEGILPSNIGHGYILRMLLRRIIRIEKKLELKDNWQRTGINFFINFYQERYPELKGKGEEINLVFAKEKEKFEKALERGLKEFKSEFLKFKDKKIIPGTFAFNLYQSYGFPLEMIKDLAKEEGFSVNEEEFQKEFQKHKEISRTGAERKFGGLGIDQIKDEEEKIKVIKYHTATHLLQAALRKILGEKVQQMGSDINSERLRFDFSFDRKLTEEEREKVENLVNEKIKENLKVKKEIMSLKEALESGALAFFKEKYPETVSVYTIYNEKTGEVFSKEICAGPHVEWTKELGFFKIQKEESLGRDLRRIKAILIEK
jgi:alanyl-tRNA synthetase